MGMNGNAGPVPAPEQDQVFVLQLSLPPEKAKLANALVDALIASGIVKRAVSEPAKPAPAAAPLRCPICEHAVHVLEKNIVLRIEACRVCIVAAERLDGLFDTSVLKHRTEFLEQLPRMVRDVRAGGDEPVFYRGFE